MGERIGLRPHVVGGNNYLDGEDGNDILTATGGGNQLFGGAGDDTLQAQGGNNYLDGEEGKNNLFDWDGVRLQRFNDAANDETYTRRNAA